MGEVHGIFLSVALQSFTGMRDVQHILYNKTGLAHADWHKIHSSVIPKWVSQCRSRLRKEKKTHYTVKILKQHLWGRKSIQIKDLGLCEIWKCFGSLGMNIAKLTGSNPHHFTVEIFIQWIPQC